MPDARSHHAIDRSALVSALLVFLLAWVGGLIVRASYSHLFFVLDDLDLLAQIGLLRTGKLTWGQYLTLPIGANPMLIWKIIVLVEWKLFGLNPVCWHIVAGTIHALSAAFLFLLLRHYLPTSIGAWVGSLLWGLAAIGQPDNPLILLCCGNFALAITWLLLAMLLVPHFARNPNFVNSALLSGAITLSLLTWGVMVALVPVIILQYLLLEWRTTLKNRPSLIWVFSWSIPCIIAYFYQLSWMLKISRGSDRQQNNDLVAIAERTVAQFGVSAKRVFFEGIAQPDYLLIGNIMLGFLGLLVLSGLWSSIHSKLAVLFFYVSMVFLVLTNIGGVEANYVEVLRMGHYHYIPILFWCVTAGMFLEMIVRRIKLRSRWIQICCSLALLLAFGAGQHRIAQATHGYFDELFSGMVADFENTRTLLEDLSSFHKDRDTTAVMPDFRTPIATHIPVFCPVSAFAEFCFPHGLENVQIRSCNTVSPSEVQYVLSLLQKSSNPIAPACSTSIIETCEVVYLVDWLSQFAVNEGLQLRVPSIDVDLPLENTHSTEYFSATHADLKEYLMFAFSSPPSNIIFENDYSNVKFPPPIKELHKILVALKANPAGEARFWEDTYSKCLPLPNPVTLQ